MKKPIIAQSENYGMGTTINHMIFGKRAKDALQAALMETERLEELLSRFIPRSDVSRINKSAGLKSEKVSKETYEILSQAIKFSGFCQGCFDITIEPLVTLWAGSKEKMKSPDELRIRDILPLINYLDVILKPCKEEIGLQKVGQSIDLGGIGKGYAADKVLEVFKKYEVTSAFTNFGGNVAVIGTKPDGGPWHIGIRHPRNANSLIGVVTVINKSVVTSGDYQRYFTGSNGKRYHHILNPFTGYPSESGLISVTMVADSSLAADALSTILFIAGMNKGIEILKSFPGTEAVLIDENLNVNVTRGLMNSFSVMDGINVNILEI